MKRGNRTIRDGSRLVTEAVLANFYDEAIGPTLRELMTRVEFLERQAARLAPLPEPVTEQAT